MDVKITVLVSEELRRRAKVAAAMHGVTLSETVRQALEDFVAGAERGRGGSPFEAASPSARPAARTVPAPFPGTPPESPAVFADCRG